MLDYITGIKINIATNLSNIKKSRYWFKFFSKGLDSHTDEPTYKNYQSVNKIMITY